MPQTHKILVTIPASPGHRQLLEQAAPGAAFDYIPAEDVQSPAGYDVILGTLPTDMLRGADSLRWLQLPSAGAEAYLGKKILPEGVCLTCATGAYGPAVAEHAFAMALTLMKKLHLYRDRQAARDWSDAGGVESIRDKTALIVGFGDIGGHFASLLRPFGARIVAIRRGEGLSPLADEQHSSLDSLDALLPEADIILLSLPNTEHTRGIMDRRRLALCKPAAILLNIGRGPAIDTDALCDAVLAGRPYAAGIDVVDPEPLPPGHRLWGIPNILLTPHISGGFHMSVTLDRLIAICADNLGRYVKGLPLCNVVTEETGYATNRYQAEGAE